MKTLVIIIKITTLLCLVFGCASGITTIRYIPDRSKELVSVQISMEKAYYPSERIEFSLMLKSDVDPNGMVLAELGEIAAGNSSWSVVERTYSFDTLLPADEANVIYYLYTRSSYPIKEYWSGIFPLRLEAGGDYHLKILNNFETETDGVNKRFELELYAVGEGGGMELLRTIRPREKEESDEAGESVSVDPEM